MTWRHASRRRKQHGLQLTALSTSISPVSSPFERLLHMLGSHMTFYRKPKFKWSSFWVIIFFVENVPLNSNYTCLSFLPTARRCKIKRSLTWRPNQGFWRYFLANFYQNSWRICLKWVWRWGKVENVKDQWNPFLLLIFLYVSHLPIYFYFLSWCAYVTLNH